MSELNVLAELCEANEASLTKKLDDLHKQMEEEGDIDNGDYLADINDYYIMVSATMPMFQNYALLTLGFSFFEKGLNDVCSELRRKRLLSVDLKDLHGQGISRAKLYLSKVCSITAPFNGDAWPKISMLNEIRNAITHRGGFVDFTPDDRRSLYSRLNDIDGIEFEWDVADQTDRQISFGNGFVLASLGYYDSFLRLLWAELQHK